MGNSATSIQSTVFLKPPSGQPGFDRVEGVEHITDVAAFDGASQAIKSKMQIEGKISGEDAFKILLTYQAVSKTISHHFPGAENSHSILRRVSKTLDLNSSTAANTLFAQSVCPDEINHEQTDITNLLANHLGECFHMGGLAGIPFTGKTGFGAFSHHVPDNGNLFVLMAPHIGVTTKCELGKYSRDGKYENDSACGAAVGAFGICCSKPKHELPELLSPANSSDYQMNYIISEVSKRLDRITVKEDPNERQVELVSSCYDIAKKMLDEILNTHFGSGKLFVLCGVQINMPRPMSDYFQPRAFYVLQANKPTVDLFDTTFA